MSNFYGREEPDAEVWADEDGNVHAAAPAGPAAATDSGVDCPPVHRLPNIPREFWEAREAHQHIRQAAHSRLVSADLVLHGVLARLSAMRSHELVFDSGRGPASLNHFVAVVGASGTGKSTGGVVVDDMLAIPHYLEPDPSGEHVRFADGLPIGSGEGIAEAFMGAKETEVDTTRKGDPVMRKIRCKVRSNVFVTADEGEVFTRIGDRKGSTIGSTLRSAWFGSAIGQANGRDDTTRVIPGRSYSLGLVIGFQPDTALPLLQDTSTGMAQRFAWVSAVDPTIPDEPVDFPGPLPVPAIIDAGSDFVQARAGVLEFPLSVAAELRADHLAKVRGAVVVPERDSQAPLMRCKLAALLALLNGCYDKVSEEDWELATILWDSSCAVRDRVTEAAAEEKIRQAEHVARTRVQLAEQQAAAVASVPAKVDRLATVLAARVVDDGGLMRAAARRGMRSTERHLFDQVVERAAELDLLRVTETGGLLPPLMGRGAA